MDFTALKASTALNTAALPPVSSSLQPKGLSEAIKTSVARTRFKVGPPSEWLIGTLARLTQMDLRGIIRSKA